MSPFVRERRVTFALRVSVIAVVVAALAVAIFVRHPEVIVENCSLAVVLLLVWLERRHSASATRSAALHNLVEELQANVSRLYAGLWEWSGTKIIGERHGAGRRLRYYYERATTVATQAALLNGALGRRKDADLVKGLHAWERAAADCNTRLAMAELHLFFLKSDEAGMSERLRVHASIAAKTVPALRKRLTSVLTILTRYAGESGLPPRLHQPVAEMTRTIRTASPIIEETTEALWAHIHCD